MKRLIYLILMLVLALPANATVNSQTNKTIVLGNGSQTAFTFNFIGVAATYVTVLFTDASGNQYALTQGSGTNQYSITLNAPVQGAIWGLGGTVTYNPSGTPIPTGSTLTIYRTLPLTQAISLQNLGSIATLGKGSETGLDTGVMQGQQINETIGRAIVANPANSVGPLPLPPAAQLANQGLCADGTGLNIIGCVLPSSGVISTAMQPVVSAATLALGRAAFGLGSAAQENIGSYGMQDDGSGNLRLSYINTSDSTNQAVTGAFHLTQRIATGPITYTLNRANTLWNGFSVKIFAVAGTITIVPNASDNFQGLASGVSITIAAGQVATLTTDGASTGTWQFPTTNTNAQFLGMNTALNLQINASVATNALTVSLKDQNGNDPTVASPIVVTFRDTTLTNGGPVYVVVTSALSITAPSGASLGTTNGNASHIWVVLFNNGGTPVLGLINCSTASRIFPLMENLLQSPTAITSGSTAAGTYYASSALTSKAFRILGYIGSTQTTAGTWATSPAKIQLYGPGIKKPGEQVQLIYTTTTTTTAVSSTVKVATALAASITPTSSANLVRVHTEGSITTADLTSTGHAVISLLYRNTGTTAIGNICPVGYNDPGGVNPVGGVTTNTVIDYPQSVSAVQYGLYIFNNTGTDTWTFLGTNGSTPAGTGIMTIEEIMGALEPANDNEPLRMVG